MDLQERLAATASAAAGAASAPSGAAGPDTAPGRVPGGDPFAPLKARIHAALVSEIGPSLLEEADDGAVRARVLAGIRARLGAEPGLSREDRDRLAGEIADGIFGYGPLERLLADPSISEVLVNGTDGIWIERQGRLSQTVLRFSDEAQLRRVIAKMAAQVGRRIDESSPMVDARLPDGSRVNAVLPPLSLSGPLLTIRRFQHDRFDMGELVVVSTLSAQAAKVLETVVRHGLNVIVSGGTGTGKTTLLNALSAAIPGSERVVTIEDAAELRLHQQHVVRLESRPPNIEGEGEVTIRDLVRNALRMRPDRIIVGEVRGGEALDMLQAMNTGHDGSLSTIHANSPRDALNRLETMVLMAGYDLPLRAIRQHLSSAIDVIVQIDRLEDGSRRVTQVTEVQRMEGDVVTLQPLFELELERVAADGVSAQLVPTGLRPGFLRTLERRGASLPAGLWDALPPEPLVAGWGR